MPSEDLPRFWRHVRRTTIALGVLAAAAIATGELRDRLAPDGAAPAAGASSTVPTPAPAVASVPRQTLTARVVAGGAPVAGADAWLSDGSGALTTARTDGDGIARFAAVAPGAYELWATHAAQASRIARIAEVTADPIELVLAPASQV